MCNENCAGSTGRRTVCGLRVEIELRFDDVKRTEQHVNVASNLVLEHVVLLPASYAYGRNFELPTLLQRKD